MAASYQVLKDQGNAQVVVLQVTDEFTCRIDVGRQCSRLAAVQLPAACGGSRALATSGPAQVLHMGDFFLSDTCNI